MSNNDHEFGGPWTEVKLDAICDYLQFFNGALKNKPTPARPFTRWYVDAFAGSGERTTKVERGGLIEGGLHQTEKVQLDGSAKRALAIEPPFNRFVFIEQSKKRSAALDALKARHPDRSIDVYRGDGNALLRGMFGSHPWTSKGGHRAVVFLDPYGMGVKWATLETLAATRAVDVWYLFNLAAVVRQLANDFAAIDEHKQLSLDEIFGTPGWREDLYRQPVLRDLFEAPVSAKKSVTPKQIEAYAKTRLATLFPYVSNPLPLVTPRQTQLFSLFCVSANDSPSAHDLIRRGVAHVLKKYG